MKTSILAVLLFIVSAIVVQAQDIQVHGTVLSKADGEPLIGATVVPVSNPNAGVATNFDGEFSLSVAAGTKLTVSYIGYNTVTVDVQSEMTIELDENSTALDEVVVVGYSTEKKADLTGSVSVVKMKDVADMPTGNVVQALQGRVAGMNVSTDGTPGGLSTSTSIRGRSSFEGGANSPLYVIDGVMTRENPGTILNPNDVESIQVLKDAASASIYGAQAANGVIIITTKRAKKGETHVTFDATLTIQKYKKGLELLDANEWGEVYWAAHKNSFGVTPSSEIYGNGATPQLQGYRNLNGEMVSPQIIDWQDEIHRTALMQTYTVGLAKGSENGGSSLSLSWLSHDGIIKGTDFKKVNSRFSSDYGFLNNRLRAGGNVTVNWWKQHLAPGGIEENAIRLHPARTAYDDSGEYNEQTAFGLNDTPNVMRLIENEKNNKHEYWRVFGNVYLSVEPIKNLIVKTNFGVNFYDETNKEFTPKYLRDQTNFLKQSNIKNTDWVWTNTAQYNVDLGKNSIMALLGIESKKYHWQEMWAQGKGLDVEYDDYLYLNNVTSDKSIGSGASDYSMFSVFGKLNYSFDNRYLASVTIRRDASSRLSHDNNADWFPSVSAGWRISQENFMESTRDWLSDLKLRAAYGVNGNDIIDNDAFYSKYYVSLNKASYNISGDNKTLASGAHRARSTNPDLRWEKTYQTNVGLDASFLNGRLNFTFDYFYKRTKDMLIQKPYIGTIGEGGYCWTNGGNMVNKGVEFTVNWRQNVNKDFSYEVGFNATVSKNEVTDLIEDIKYNYGGGNINHSLVGQPFGSWMGFKTDGVFHSQAEVDEYKRKYDVRWGNPAVGRIKYVDENGDGVIDYGDRTWLGSDLPKAQFGLNMSAFYKGFDLSLFFTSIIRDAYNNSKWYTDLFQLWGGNHGKSLLDATHAWQEFERTGYYDCDTPAPIVENPNSENECSQFYIENGSFLRLKSLTLGYTLPRGIMEKIKMQNARVYFQAQNVFTITKYTGADPEGLGYPYSIPRQFTFGIQFGF